MPETRSEDRLYDKRLHDRFVEKGALDPKDLQKHLKALPDLTDEAEIIDVALEPVGDDTDAG